MGSRADWKGALVAQHGGECHQEHVLHARVLGARFDLHGRESTKDGSLLKGGGVHVGWAEGRFQGKKDCDPDANHKVQKPLFERGRIHAHTHTRTYAHISGSPTANWKDATCWRFRTEMLQLHVSKMRTEAQNRYVLSCT